MKQLILKSLFCSLFILLTTQFFAQGTVRGTVIDKANGEAVIFTNVKIKGTSLGASTDVNGVYQIADVPAGTHVLEVSNISYKTLEQEFTLKDGQVLMVKLVIEENDELLDEFEISAEQIESVTKVKISVVKATKKEISAVVSVGGEADIATYFQTVPGVISTGDQGGQMYVRGGSPVQNKVLLDGMTIYNPFHSIGFFSVFDTDIIRNADIYTGGYGSQYGGRISSIMDITTKGGNKRELDGRIAVNPFGAKVMLNGPLKALDENGEGTAISYILSGKTSYLEQSSRLFYNYVDTAGLPFNYTDLYGKVSVDGDRGSKVNIFGFKFSDQVKWQALSDLNWDSWGVGSNFVLLPSGSKMQIEGKFNYSDYVIKMADRPLNPEDVVIPKSSNVNGFNMGFDFKYFHKDDEVKYGIEVNGLNTDFSFANTVGRLIDQQTYTTELGLYIDYKIVRGRMVVNPGFRAQYFASYKKLSPEPRIGMKFNVTEDFRIKMAGGVYSQNLISANSDRDVVNLFYGFLTGPDHLQDEFTKKNGTVVERRHNLQKATHSVAGFEYDLGKHLSLNVEGYYKYFNQLTNMNRNKIYDDTPDNSKIPDIYKKDFIIETGDAKGVDLVLKYSTDRTYLWFVYSLGKVSRWDGIQEYSPVFDRRHNINLVATYFIDKKKNWEIDARWNFGSGLPFTQTQGYFHAIDYGQGIGTDITTSNASNLNVIYAGLNEGRLSAYHRLDMSLKRKFNFENSHLETTASVTNAYSRNNIFYVDRVTNSKVYQLPILPSLGVSWTF